MAELEPEIYGPSRDGEGAGDNDKPFIFGHPPFALRPAPFSTHHFLKLQLLRSKLSELKLRLRGPESEPWEGLHHADRSG